MHPCGKLKCPYQARQSHPESTQLIARCAATVRKRINTANAVEKYEQKWKQKLDDASTDVFCPFCRLPAHHLHTIDTPVEPLKWCKPQSVLGSQNGIIMALPLTNVQMSFSATWTWYCRQISVTLFGRQRLPFQRPQSLCLALSFSCPELGSRFLPGLSGFFAFFASSALAASSRHFTMSCCFLPPLSDDLLAFRYHYCMELAVRHFIIKTGISVVIPFCWFNAFLMPE